MLGSQNAVKIVNRTEEKEFLSIFSFGIGGVGIMKEISYMDTPQDRFKCNVCTEILLQSNLNIKLELFFIT